jgi:hypothetical protein
VVEVLATAVFQECGSGGLGYYRYLVNVEVLLPEGCLHAVVRHAIGAVQVEQVLRALVNILILVFFYFWEFWLKSLFQPVYSSA